MAKGVVLALAFGLLVSSAALGGCAKPTPVDRAQQLVRLHREIEAIDTLRSHLALHPEDIAARRLLVRVLAFSGDLEGAKGEVTELQRRLPNDPVPWVEMGHAYELAHKFEEALAAYDTASSVAPASPVGPREGGLRCARWGEPEAAEPRLSEAVRRGAHDAETLHALGLVRVNLHDWDGAQQAYEQGLAADPKSTENLLGLATVAVMRGDGAGALAAYDAILSRKPSFAGAELGRAWALAKLGRRTEAERALDRATELGAPRENVEKQRRALRTGAL